MINYLDVSLAICLFSIVFLQLSSSTVVHVNSFIGNDSACTDSFVCHGMVSSTPCQTIEHAYSLIKGASNAEIYLDSSVTLHQVLKFQGVQDVSILGISALSHHGLINVTCQGEAGIFVESVRNFSISHITLFHCVNQYKSKCYKAGVILIESSQVTLFNLTIARSKFSGLLLMNCYGNINISRVNFTDNKYKSKCTRKKYKEGKAHLLRDNILRYANVNDDHNAVSYGTNYSRHKCVRPGNVGGGLNIVLTGNPNNSTTIIEKCNFIKNSANWGGGLHIRLDDGVADSLISVSSTTFLENRACKEGGGLRINIRSTSHEVYSNHIIFEDSDFVANTAKFAGGVGIVSSYNSVNNSEKESIKFRHCRWNSNTAKVTSPAVDIASYARLNSERYGFLPTPYFEDISIINNSVVHILKPMRSITENDGVFLITQMKVIFSGHICFCNNSPAALKAVSGGIVVENNTTITFYNNRGTNGAAVALYGYSYIHFSDNIHITFKHNKAKNKGAAIFYHGIDQHDFFVGSYCFLERKDSKPHNVTLIFDTNEAENDAWIYAESFLSCALRCNASLNVKSLKFENIVQCIGDFHFVNRTESIVTEKVVATSARQFIFQNHTKPKYSVIPGGKLKLPYIVKDEFNNSLSPLTFISPTQFNSPISFDRKYSLDKHIYPIGLPNDTATVDVAIQGVRRIHFQFQLHTFFCPPGFVYDKSTRSCECGNDQSKEFYAAILGCNMTSYQALLDKQYWAGYIPEDSQSYSHLYFVPCFPPICSYNKTYLNRSNTLNRAVCGDHKTGIMCGECSSGLTVFYHSKTYSCRGNKNCRYGPLFYILSELLPLFIVFLIVSVFDLTLTSGNVVGFIFFCQFLEGTTVDTSPIFSYAKAPYRLFYGIFNLNYFSTESLSFCLWKTFHIQEVIAFKYITICFAFTLVIAQILSLKTNRFVLFFKLRKYISNKRSFIHGLCAFLVMCYIQCTKTSFLLLKYVRPEGLNGKQGDLYTYYGGKLFFQQQHAVYASLALFFLVTITIPPLLILLLHPFLLQLLSLCHLSEHWLVLKVMKILCIQKLIPFLDCFQSCYKDKYRMFAGLYFAYRVALLLLFITANSYSNLLFGLQMLLLLFLGIHAVVQPYKKKLHNVLDSLIFTNLSTINMLSIFALNETRSQYILVAIEVIQIMLFYLPMIACILYIAWKIYTYYKSREFYYPYALLDDTEVSSDRDYESQQCELNSSSIVINS